MFGDIRIAIYLAYIALLLWKARIGALDDWWKYIIAFAVLQQVTRLAEDLHLRWQMRRGVQVLRSLDPDDAARILDRMWSGSPRQYYRERLDAEGSIVRDGSTERFPFSPTTQRETTIAYWCAAGATATVFAVLLIGGPGIPRFTGRTLWTVGGTLCVLAGWARGRSTHLETVLEITPFGLAELTEDGARGRSVRWTQALVLRARPRLRRLDLHSEDGVVIPLDYARIGFARLVALVLDYGHFFEASAPVIDSADATVDESSDDEPSED